MSLMNLTPFFRMFDGVLGYIYQLDEFFGFVALLVTLLITFYSYKIYSFSKRDQYLLFSASFFLISIGFFSKLIFDIALETESLTKTLFLGSMHIPGVEKLLMLGYMFFVLAGYMLLLIVALRIRKEVSLYIFMIAIVSLFVSQNYYITFLSIMVIVLAALLLHFYRNFAKTKLINAGLVWYAFVMIMFAQIMSFLIIYSNKFYLLSNLFNITGFLFLLSNFILVLRK